MIKQKTKPTYPNVILDDLNRDLGSKYSAKDAIEYLTNGCSDYEIRLYSAPRKTASQRLWFVFLSIIFTIAAPVQWLITGKIGVSSKTRLGRIILKIAGER